MLSFPSLSITRINDVLVQNIQGLDTMRGNVVNVLKFLLFHKETEVLDAKKPPSLRCKILQGSPGTSRDYHSILQIRKQRSDEVNWFAQGHTSSKFRS